MKENGVQPDTIFFTALMDGFGCVGLPNNSFGVLKFMIDEGCVPNSVTYSVLLKHFLNVSKTANSEISFPKSMNVWKVLTVEKALEFLDELAKHC